MEAKRRANWSYGDLSVIRKANINDLTDVFKLRNKKYVRDVSWNINIIKWSEHKAFWKKNYQYYWIIQSCSDASFVGFIRIKNKKISVVVLKEFWNQGYGYFAVQQLKKQFSNLRAEIKLGNNHSLCFFVKCGFVPSGFVMNTNEGEY